MNPNPNKLAIIIAFYLSKFDKAAKERLGYLTDSEAFEQIAQILNVKKNYIKFRRDEFDPIHPWRKGWLRPMDTRIVRAIEALQDLTEMELGEIAFNILNDPDFKNNDDVIRISELITDEKSLLDKKKRSFILRGSTGKKAEEYFVKNYADIILPLRGELIDTRDNGCGYDFEIKTEDDQKFFFEVKGLSQTTGGILFTNKEWETAKKDGDRYYLVLVSNLDNVPSVRIIQNPSVKYKPQKNIITTVQTQWSITNSQLFNV